MLVRRASRNNSRNNTLLTRLVRPNNSLDTILKGRTLETFNLSPLSATTHHRVPIYLGVPRCLLTVPCRRGCPPTALFRMLASHPSYLPRTTKNRSVSPPSRRNGNAQVRECPRCSERWSGSSRILSIRRRTAESSERHLQPYRIPIDRRAHRASKKAGHVCKECSDMVSSFVYILAVATSCECHIRDIHYHPLSGSKTRDRQCGRTTVRPRTHYLPHLLNHLLRAPHPILVRMFRLLRAATFSNLQTP